MYFKPQKIAHFGTAKSDTTAILAGGLISYYFVILNLIFFIKSD